MDAKRRIPPMVPDDQDSYCVINNSKQKMVREALKIDPANVPLTNSEGLRPTCGIEHKAAEFGIKGLRELSTSDMLVIGHDDVNVSTDLTVQDELHHCLRSLTAWSS